MTINRVRERIEQLLLFIALAAVPITVGLWAKGEARMNPYPEGCYVQVQK